MKIFQQFVRFIRWNDWGPGKTTILSGLCFYIAASNQLDFVFFAFNFVLFLLFAAAQSTMGFVLNDWGDRDLDKRQGKSNSFNHLPTKTSRKYLALVVALAILTGLPFISQLWFLPLWIAWGFVTIGYSLPPLRFKTRGSPGLAFSFAAQWSLPVFIAFASFGQLNSIDVWLWAAALTLSGATLEIAHQRYDRDRDAATQAETFAVRSSQNFVDRLYATAVLLDKLAVGMITTLGLIALVGIDTWWSKVLASALGFCFVFLFVLTFPEAWGATRGGQIQDPYYSTGYSITRLLHETLPNFGIPLILVFAISLIFPAYFTLLVFFVIWRLAFGKANLAGLFQAITKAVSFSK